MSDQTCTQANVLATFPLTTTRDRRWWSHWHSLGSPNTSTSFFMQDHSEKWQWTCQRPGLARHWLKVVIALEVMVFLAFCNFSLCSRETSLSGNIFVMVPSKSGHNCCAPYWAWVSVQGTQSQSIWPPSVICQADSQQAPRWRGDECRSTTF